MDIDRQAAEWLVRLENREQPLTAAQQTAFFDWLAQSPKHLQAYLDIADLRACLEGFDRDRRIDLAQLLVPRPGAVVSHKMAPVHGGRSSPRRRLVWAAAAGIAIAAIGAVATVTVRAVMTDDLRTVVGEQRSYKLSDGSVVHLNTRSRLNVDFSKQAREVRLLDGEALFSVEGDPRRPFYVVTDTARIQALGTQFNVYRHPDSGETTVAVVDGLVQVTPTSAQSANRMAAARLAAGQEARIAGGDVVKRAAAPVADAIAWRDRRLVFENAPLDAVATEFNRYNAVQIRTVGSIGRTQHIAGIFSADHPQSLILHLKRDVALDVQEVGNTFIVRARSASDPAARRLP